MFIKNDIYQLIIFIRFCFVADYKTRFLKKNIFAKLDEKQQKTMNNSPKEALIVFMNSSFYKTSLSITKFAVLAILGGAFIALGGLLSVMVAGGMSGIGAENPGLIKFISGATFPVGLIIVALTKTDLFTSDCAAFTIPLWEKKMKFFTFLKYLFLSYIFNFIGVQFVAYFLSAHLGYFNVEPWQSYLHILSTAKVNQSWEMIFLKGIGANWLVCLAIFLAFIAKDTVGKVIVIWIPIMMFVTLGYEHSIANMFFIPAAIYSGAPITWGEFIFRNLIPATLGNFVGGGLLVGTAFWYLYLHKSEKLA